MAPSRSSSTPEVRSAPFRTNLQDPAKGGSIICVEAEARHAFNLAAHPYASGGPLDEQRNHTSFRVREHCKAVVLRIHDERAFIVPVNHLNENPAVGKGTMLSVCTVWVRKPDGKA